MENLSCLQSAALLPRSGLVHRESLTPQITESSGIFLLLEKNRNLELVFNQQVDDQYQVGAWNNFGYI